MNQTENRPETTPMKRGEFIRSLGLSSAALMAFYCMGTLTSCSNSNDDPTPSNPTNPGNKVDFTLDLNAAANANLKTEGGFVTQGNVIVARVKGGAYAALSRICTHQGGSLEYQLATDRLSCPLHGSAFSTAGAVLNGPATTALKVYKTTLTGTNLRVFED